MAGTITTLTQYSLSQKALWTSGKASTSYCGGAALTGKVQLILWGCSSYCEGAAHTVGCSSYCGVQLLLWGAAPTVGVQFILWGAAPTVRVQLLLWGCSSYCGDAACTVGVQLVLWGCSLYCGGTACTAGCSSYCGDAAHSASVCPTYLYFSHPVLCRQWFSVACQRSHSPDSQGVIVKAVKSMIPDTITIVSSRWVTSWFRPLVYQHPVILVTGRVYYGVGLPDHTYTVYYYVCTWVRRKCLCL